MDRKRKLENPGWCRNLIGASSLVAGERVLVVVDESLVEEGAQLAAAVQDAGGECCLELWGGRRRPLDEPPAPALEAARQADLMLALQQDVLGPEGAARASLRDALTDRGGRAIFLGFVDGELLRGELSRPQADLSETARALARRFAGCKQIRVRAPGGTDLSVRVDGRPWVTDAKPLAAGDYANFPSGEIFVSPLEDSAEGALVADLTVPFTVEGLVDEPVRLQFERGRGVSIEGGRAAQMLRELVADAGAGGDVIAELGIGFNPAIRPRGHVMLDEKAAGTAHVAIGRNTGPYGGTNEATIHVDCVFSRPEIEADGAIVQLP